jgi:hypothetical protein
MWWPCLAALRRSCSLSSAPGLGDEHRRIAEAELGREFDRLRTAGADDVARADAASERTRPRIEIAVGVEIAVIGGRAVLGPGLQNNVDRLAVALARGRRVDRVGPVFHAGAERERDFEAASRQHVEHGVFFRQAVVVGLFAGRIVASRRNELVERRLGEAEPLLHVGDDLHHLADEVAVVGLDDFGDEVGADRLAVLVELDLPVRRVEHDLVCSAAELLVVVRKIALDLVERLKHRVGRVVVVDGEQRGAGEGILEVAGLRMRLVGLHERLPFRVRVVVGHAAGGDGADQRVLGLALRRQHGLVDHDRAAEQVGVAAGLLILVEEVHRVGAAEAEIDGVDVIGQRRNDRGEVLGAERHPEALGDLAAGLAELDRQSHHLRVDEGIIFADRRDLLVVLDVVGVVAEAACHCAPSMLLR